MHWWIGLERVFNLFCCHVDILSAGVWSLYEDIQDPQLVTLAKALLDTVLRSRADSTVKKYINAFRRWKEWASSRSSISIFPVKGHQLVLYLQHIGLESGSRSAVEEAVNAVAWVHGIEGVQNSPIVKATVAGLRRVLSKPKTKKEPVTLDMLHKMADSLSRPPSLEDSRLLALSLLAFSAFLRFDEVIRVRCCDVTFLTDHMVISIVSSKTDQYREGSSIVVIRSGSDICPVTRMEEYFKIANLEAKSTEYLFRGISNTKNGSKLRASGSLSYTRVRELLHDKLQSLGFEHVKYPRSL